MFFVISGYLITQLILLGLQDRTFSLWGFYQRRVRRIVPALLLIPAACFVFGWFVLLPGEFSGFGRSMAWCAAFLANVFFATNTRYFEPWADYNPLLHLWSLGVEEQFYLVWPLLLLLAMRYGVTRPLLRAVIDHAARGRGPCTAAALTPRQARGHRNCLTVSDLEWPWVDSICEKW